MRTPGSYVRYHGRDYRVSFPGDHWVAIDDAPDVDVSDLLPIAIETGSTHPSGPWVKVPKSHFQRYVRVEIAARWRGEPVWIDGICQNGLIRIGYLGATDFADAHGLRGHQREGGFFGEVPEEELSNVKVTERDIPLR